MRRIVSMLLIALLALGWLTAFAQPSGIQIDEVVTRQGSSYVSYPQLSGMPNTFVQDSINRAIVADGGIPAYLATLTTVTDLAATGLTVMSSAQVLPGAMGGLLAVRLEAQGRIGPGRPGHAVVPLMYSLTTGQRVVAGDLFLDTDMAISDLEEMIAREIEPDVSAYLSADALYPLPVDSLLADEAGIAFYYDQAQYTTLSGQSGAVHFTYDELLPLLNTREGSILRDVLAFMPQAPSAEAAEAVRRDARAGRLPGLDVQLGDSLDEVLAAYPQLVDPEAFPAGEKYHLEDARWRGAVLIADRGKVMGILSRRMSLYGLKVGRSDSALVRQTLGQASASLTLDEQAALSYGMASGTLDSYAAGENTLHFNYDDNGILRAIWLSRAE